MILKTWKLESSDDLTCTILDVDLIFDACTILFEFRVDNLGGVVKRLASIVLHFLIILQLQAPCAISLSLKHATKYLQFQLWHSVISLVSLHSE